MEAMVDMNQDPDELSTSPKKDRLFIEAVARAFRILEGFADRPEPLSLSQLAAAAGVDKSSAQRIAHTLGQLGYLEQGANGFVPGRKVLERSFDYLRTNPLVSRALPILAELRRNVQERVDLSLWDDLTMLYLARLQSKRDTFFAHLAGRRVPTYATAGGRSVLSVLSEEEALDILNRSDRRKLTPRTTTEVGEIMKQVEAARNAGYSVSLEQVHIGEVAVATVLTDKQGRPVAAIHVSGSLSEWEPDQFERKIAPLVVAAATAIKAD